MKVRLIFCLLFLLIGVVLVTVSQVISNPVKAVTTTEPVKIIKSSENVLFGQSLSDSFLQTSCLMGRGNSTPFSFKNPLFPSQNSSFGQNNPLLISDRVAYTMVFRLLSSHKNDPTQIKRLRAYIRQNLGITQESDITAVFSLASNFKQRISPLDNQITAIKDRYHVLGHPPYSQADLQRFATLKQNKERVVDSLITDIPRRMSTEGRNKLNQRIQDHVKARIKIQSE